MQNLKMSMPKVHPHSKNSGYAYVWLFLWEAALHLVGLCC